MQATYVGHLYKKWEMEGKSGEYTEVYYVKDFALGEPDGVGQIADKLKVAVDLRPKLEGFVPGVVMTVELDVDRKGRAVLRDFYMDPVKADKK